MKSKFIYFLTLVVLLSACSKDNSSGVLGGKWKMVKYHNTISSTSESEPANLQRSIVINFNDDASMGKMSGQTVTNTVGGSYELLPNQEFKTTGFGGTKIGEPRWGARFWNAIYAANSYRRSVSQLFIYFNNGTEMMEFTKE